MEKEKVVLPNGSIKYVYERYNIRFNSHALERIEERKQKNVHALFFETIKKVSESVMEKKVLLQMHKNGHSFFIVRTPEDIVLVYSIASYKTLCLVTIWNEQDGSKFHTKGDPEFKMEMTRNGIQFNPIEKKGISHNEKTAI